MIFVFRCFRATGAITIWRFMWGTGLGSRRKVWDVLLRARAIENACYVAGVNRVGKDPGSNYDGGTCLVDFRGDVAGMAADNKEETLLLHADIDELRDFRNGFRVLDDADGFELRI